MGSILSIDPYLLLRWLALGGLLLLYGFFATAETALFALNPLDRLRLREKRPQRGALVESLLQQSQRLLITLIVGVEFITILASVLATSLALRLWGDTGKWLALLVMSPTLLLLGEVIPKSVALTYPARLAPLVAPWIRGAMLLFAPLRILLLQISRGILATLGFRPDLPVPAVQQEDFVRMVEESHIIGVLATQERNFIQNLLDFGEIRIGQIMVPRPDIFSLPISMPVDQIVQAIKRSRFSRVPVYEDRPGNTLGILHAKDLLDVCTKKTCDVTVLRNVLRTPYYVPENKQAFDLMTELQSRRVRMALVVDEYGTLVGLVTMEDILEELFGEIAQEFAIEEKPWEPLGPGVWRVKATVTPMDLNEALGLALPTVEFDTIGGMVFNLFGELPREGDRVSYDHLIFKVLKMKGTRILELEVKTTS